jgi:hypothetical protein
MDARKKYILNKLIANMSVLKLVPNEIKKTMKGVKSRKKSIILHERAPTYDEMMAVASRHDMKHLTRLDDEKA